MTDNTSLIPKITATWSEKPKFVLSLFKVGKGSKCVKKRSRILPLVCVGNSTNCEKRFMLQKFSNDRMIEWCMYELAKGANVPHASSGKLKCPIMKILELLID